MKQDLGAAFSALVTLEQQVSNAAALANANDRMRVYEWRPSAFPELPAIWNWIEPSDHEIVDTMRADDWLIVKSTIGVQPSDLAQSMGRLVRLTDIFRTVVDPALNTKPVLNGTARYAKRVVTGSSMDEFEGGFVMCMDMILRLDLTANIR